MSGVTVCRKEVPLSDLPREIAALNGGRGHTPKYRELYNACVDARIPAKKGINGRWTVLRRNVPAIARKFAEPAERI
jgi:hypothetical protein